MRLCDNIQNMKFGRWTILSKVNDTDRKLKKTYRWNAICECGTESIVSASNVINGKSLSCGCIRTEGQFKGHGVASYNTILRFYKANAAKKNIEFKLNSEQFKEYLSKPCYYCKEEPKKTQKSKSGTGDFTYNGIDRVNSSKGYEIENCVTCCQICNIMKNTLTLEQFIHHINKLHDNFKEMSWP